MYVCISKYIHIFKMRKITCYFADGKDTVDKKKKRCRREDNCRNDVLVYEKDLIHQRRS